MKPLSFAATTAFHQHFGEYFSEMLSKTLTRVFTSFPFDMFVFEPSGDKAMSIRLAGYNCTTGERDEATVVLTLPAAVDRPFWLKIDDYGNRYHATFLFPEEY